MLEKKLEQYIRENEQLIKDLHLVRSLNLPQCYIAAGYIRNYVWDRLHGYPNREKHQDIDVVYYDLQDPSEERDIRLEKELVEGTGNGKWSVKNQARMHIRNGEAPYCSTGDAISRWPETATATGIRMMEDNSLDICSPHGLEDLFGMVVRRSPLFNDRAYYLERVCSKAWKRHWPLLTVLED